MQNRFIGNALVAGLTLAAVGCSERMSSNEASTLLASSEE
jgi:hypothetical protein